MSKISTRAFTLIELLICVGIIGMIAAIVLVKYKSFDSTTLLKSTAYEVALALREVQVKSMSVERGTGSSFAFDYPKGITFTSGTTNGKTYRVFQFTQTVTGSDGNPYPTTNPPFFSSVAGDTTVLSTATLPRSMYVKDMCVTVSGSPVCSLDRLDISFKRPEFKAYFYATKSSGGPYNDAQISDAYLTIASPQNPSNEFKVSVSHLGQISVSKN